MVNPACWLTKQKKLNNLRQLHPLHRLGGGRIQLLDDLENSAPLLDFSSNDYLALSEHPAVIKKSCEALDKFGTGAGAARLMSGDLELNHQLEQAIACLKNQEAALIFGSGYMANSGIIPALLGRNDLIFTDRTNHASIYDGCRLSRAQIVRFHHNDLNHLEKLLKQKRGSGKQALIVVESIYSMDGDRCPLPDLVGLKNQYDTLLMVDEAHATGLFGANGGGIIEEDGVSDSVDLTIGTFGKALGSYGAYVAASEEIINYLINRTRSFIYSTALPPAVLAASIAAVQIIQQEVGLREELHRKVNIFKKTLYKGGLNRTLGPSQIIPLVIGKSDKTLMAAKMLSKRHIFVTAIRPPTVANNTARLRLSITCHHSEADLQQTAETILQVLDEVRR